MAPTDLDLDRLSHVELKDLVLKLLGEVAELRRTVDAQRDETPQLKGGPGRPNIKPSGMEEATEPKAPPKASDALDLTCIPQNRACVEKGRSHLYCLHKE